MKLLRDILYALSHSLIIQSTVMCSSTKPGPAPSEGLLHNLLLRTSTEPSYFSLSILLISIKSHIPNHFYSLTEMVLHISRTRASLNATIEKIGKILRCPSKSIATSASIPKPVDCSHFKNSPTIMSTINGANLVVLSQLESLQF